MNPRDENSNEGGVLRSIYNFLTWPFRKVVEIVSNPSKKELMEELERFRLKEKNAVREPDKSEAEVVDLKSKVSQLEKANGKLQALVDNLKSLLEGLKKKKSTGLKEEKAPVLTQHSLFPTSEPQKPLREIPLTNPKTGKPMTEEEEEIYLINNPNSNKHGGTGKHEAARNKRLTDRYADNINKIEAGLKNWSELSSTEREYQKDYVGYEPSKYPNVIKQMAEFEKNHTHLSKPKQGRNFG
jgi:hypothetical protein